jgi:hypothetical protein
VKGCTVLTGYQTYSESAWLSPSKLTTAYRKELTRLVGCVNNAAFRGYAGGEVRFEGASARWQKHQKTKAKVSYKFSISPNSASISVGGVPSRSAKQPGAADRQNDVHQEPAVRMGGGLDVSLGRGWGRNRAGRLGSSPLLSHCPSSWWTPCCCEHLLGAE